VRYLINNKKEPRGAFKNGNFMKKMFGGISLFIKEVFFELKRVNWLSRKQLIQYTFVVIGLSAFMAAFLGVLDAGFVYGLTNYIVK